MSTIIPVINFDPSVLVGYFQSQLTNSTLLSSAQSSTPSSNAATSSSSTNSATANDVLPWMVTPKSSQSQEAQILSTTNFLDTSKVPLTPNAQANAKTEQDNQKLFALYTALNTLSGLASLSQRAGMTTGQLAGFNTRFQTGLQQVKSYLSSTTFNDFTLQMGNPSAIATSTATVPFPSFGYTGGTIVGDANVGNPLANVSTSDSFNIGVTANGTTTNVAINLAKVSGPLTIDNIVSYVNQQLSAAGFTTRFARVITQGSIDNPTKASYGIAINSTSGESIALSSASATPALYLAGSSGLASASTTTTTTLSTTSTTTTPADQQGRLVKLTGLGASPQSEFSATTSPTSGTTTAQATVVDANGDVYVVGNATGNFGSQINQGTQDVYLSKYDSAGNLQWTRLVGSAGSASGYSLALDPTGGVVVAGSSTANLTTTAIGNGNTDTFVAKYDAQGNQSWVQQLPTLSDNQPAAVSVDSSGNVIVGGNTTGIVGINQTNAGQSDAYVAKLDASGNIVYQKEFGTTGKDTVSATAVTSGGSLIVASVQNGDAILTKYANGDATTAPVWQVDLGALNNGGSIGGLAVSGNQIYVSGTTSNANLTAGGQASIVTANSGSTDAFVFGLTDQGASVTANRVSYVGNGQASQAGAVTVDASGTVYLVGSTTGTFSGQTRNVAGVNNMFAAAIASNGTIGWTRQFGGADGQSAGQGIAIDTQGSSVLDALGLPRGTISTNQSVDLASQTTLRAGDSFSIEIQGPSGVSSRSFNITIDKGETLNSLVTKLNAELVGAGKASVNFAVGAEGLKIQASTGYTLTLKSGPANFDALRRLGITAGVLTGAAGTTSSAASASSAKNAPKVFGLGLTGTLDISTASGAGAANAVLLNVLSNIRNIYQKTNAPPSSTTAASGNTSGSVPAALQSQLANFNLALSLLGNTSTNSGTNGSASPGSLFSTTA